eukprot:3560120-Amphidinium_carterae.1
MEVHAARGACCATCEDVELLWEHPHICIPGATNSSMACSSNDTIPGMSSIDQRHVCFTEPLYTISDLKMRASTSHGFVGSAGFRQKNISGSRGQSSDGDERTCTAD